MTKLTDDLKTELRTAIERARGYAKCRYADDEGPKCVIGQLIAIRGSDPAAIPMQTVEIINLCSPEGRVANAAGRLVPTYNKAVATVLSPFPLNLLSRLQACWDGLGPAEDADDARVEMLNIVEAA